MKRYYDDTFGFGEVVYEDAEVIEVRFDADPWGVKSIRKEKKNEN